MHVFLFLFYYYLLDVVGNSAIEEVNTNNVTDNVKLKTVIKFSKADYLKIIADSIRHPRKTKRAETCK